MPESDVKPKKVEEDEDVENTDGATVGVGDSEIPLQSLNLQQLQQLAQQLQVETQGLNRSLQGLTDGSSRFSQSAECLEQLGKHIADSDGSKQKMLVPLSQSVYIDGYIAKPDKVLVDIGTGYYVERNLEGAKAFLKKRVDMIQGNAAKVSDLIKRKESMMQDTQQAFQAKYAQMQQMNAETAAAAGVGAQ